MIVCNHTVPQKRKNYAVTFCLLTITGVVSLFHNYYQISLVAPLLVIVIPVIYTDTALFNKIAVFAFCILIVSLITWGLFESNGDISLISGTVFGMLMLFFVLWNLAKTMLAFIKNHAEYSYNSYRERNETLTAIHVDPLTNLYTRNAFFETLSSNINISNETGRQLILVITNIDGIRTINTLYGKTNGDEVLKSFSELLKYTFGNIRNTFRYSGNTFATLFENKSIDAVEDAVNTLRSSFAAMQFNFNNDLPTFTVSAGIACYCMDMTDTEFFDEAAKALYRAKAEGKDTVAISSSSKPL
ncbi:MAG: GGDEF domain-containing protein [Treponema sp.]|nr:GGDEF domain-containing protein [Treponema sp.]